ncbi:TLC domain-containing protein [Xylogone sp. PMI_703]|nr:TLC domain-containing protein [Xylogone sp. PMI_703]
MLIINNSRKLHPTTLIITAVSVHCLFTASDNESKYDRMSVSSSSSTIKMLYNGHAHHPSEPKTQLSQRRKTRVLVRRFRRFAIRHTWTIPLLLLIIFLSIYALNPTESNIVHPFIFLSYKLPLKAGADPNIPPQYGKGLWDIAFVSFYTIVLSFTREFIMQELLRPLARHYGIKSRGKQARYMEQMYTAIYFAVMGPSGVYVMQRTPVWYFNTQGMYEGFPHRTHEAVFKFYYLFQAAYWAQQGIVILAGMEKPRKDFKELVAHHIVTLTLIGLSYRFHFTYMGIAVYLTHDISDFFLAVSKSCNYIGSPLQVPFFGVCVTMWTYLRHYQNLRIIYSLFTEFRTVGPYELNWETQQYKCWISNIIVFVLLASLQALNLFWLYCLLRSAYRLVVYKIAKDDRSEDESEPEEMGHDETSSVPVKTPETLLTYLNANGTTQSGVNGVIKATSNDITKPVTRRGNAE